MESTREVPDFVGGARYWRKRSHALWPNCFGEPRPHSYERWANTKIQSIGRTSTTATTTPRLCSSKRENVSDYKTSGNKTALQTNSSEQTMRQNPNQQFEGSEDYDCVVDRETAWKWYKEQQGNLPHTSSSSSSSWQNPSWQNWNSCMVVAFFKAWRRAMGDFFLTCSFGSPERSTDNSTESVHRIHTRSVQHEQYSLLTSTDHICACGSSLTAQDCSATIVRMKTVSHLVRNAISLLVSSTSSHFQSTTSRSARRSPRRHCTPSTSSGTFSVDKQR